MGGGDDERTKRIGCPGDGGASRGIGRALAVRLHQAGMRVAVTARSAEALDALAAELGGEGDVLALPGDVTDPRAVTAVAETAERVLGPIDLLVNNAGAAEPHEAPVWESDPEEWWGTVTTNVLGPMLYVHAVVPGMLARGSGRIVNVNSLLGVWTLPTQTAYSVSKAALAKLTAALSAGLAGTGGAGVRLQPRPGPHGSDQRPRRPPRGQGRLVDIDGTGGGRRARHRAGTSRRTRGPVHPRARRPRDPRPAGRRDRRTRRQGHHARRGVRRRSPVATVTGQPGVVTRRTSP
ncbi:SDR family oxidoreductase [Nonomuraea ferruginea]